MAAASEKEQSSSSEIAQRPSTPTKLEKDKDTVTALRVAHQVPSGYGCAPKIVRRKDGQSETAEDVLDNNDPAKAAPAAKRAKSADVRSLATFQESSFPPSAPTVLRQLTAAENLPRVQGVPESLTPVGGLVPSTAAVAVAKASQLTPRLRPVPQGDTPEKAALKGTVSNLEASLHASQALAQQQLGNQRAGFQRAALEYRQEARAIAEAKVENVQQTITSESQAACNALEARIQELKAAESHQQFEAQNFVTQMDKEARDIIWKEKEVHEEKMLQEKRNQAKLQQQTSELCAVVNRAAFTVNEEQQAKLAMENQSMAYQAEFRMLLSEHQEKERQKQQDQVQFLSAMEQMKKDMKQLEQVVKDQASEEKKKEDREKELLMELQQMEYQMKVQASQLKKNAQQQQSPEEKGDEEMLDEDYAYASDSDWYDGKKFYTPSRPFPPQSERPSSIPAIQMEHVTGSQKGQSSKEFGRAQKDSQWHAKMDALMKSLQAERAKVEEFERLERTRNQESQAPARKEDPTQDVGPEVKPETGEAQGSQRLAEDFLKADVLGGRLCCRSYGRCAVAKAFQRNREDQA